MEVQRHLPDHFKPEDFNVCVKGRSIKVTELSREDLLQLACQAMDVTYQLSVLMDAQQSVINRWDRGVMPESLTAISARIAKEDQDAPEQVEP